MYRSYSPERPPYNCWGIQYEEHDEECKECDARESCKAEIFRKAATNRPPYVRPPTYSPPSWQRPTYSSTVRPTPPATTTSAMGNMDYLYSPPLADGQMIYGQYPQEETGERLAKNILLRVGETAVGEIWKFLHRFPWPPKGHNEIRSKKSG